MNINTLFVIASLLFTQAYAAEAKLLVTLDKPESNVGAKNVIKLKIKNTFKEAITSARATVFLTDENGKLVGQSTQWIIGGTKDKPPLKPDAVSTFNFVIKTDKPFSTTKLIFNRILLDGGKVADVVKDVELDHKPGSP